MTAVVQGASGIALTLALLLLWVRHATLLGLTVGAQSIAVAVAAVAAHRPVLAAPCLVVVAGLWLLRDRLEMLRGSEPATPWLLPGGVALTFLCQSQGAVSASLSVALLALMFAATSGAPLALLALQNGLVLACCLVPHLPLLAQLPLAAAGLVVAAPAVAAIFPWPRDLRLPTWAGWIDLGLCFAVLAATLTLPLDGLGSLFAPLLAVDGVARSWLRVQATGLHATTRGLVLLRLVLMVASVSTPVPLVASLAIGGALLATQSPTLWRWPERTLLAFAGAALLPVGLAIAPATIGYVAVFAGFAVIAIVAPDLGVVAAVLLLRLALTHLPQEASIAAAVVSIAGLLVAAWLRRPQSAICAIAALSLAAGHADGRFAAMVLLLLAIPVRMAQRFPDRTVITAAGMGLTGALPVGVFPALVLVASALAARSGWFLLPLGIAIVPAVIASLPRPMSWRWAASPGWLPLAVALAAGYFAPEGMVSWLQAIASGQP